MKAGSIFKPRGHPPPHLGGVLQKSKVPANPLSQGLPGFLSVSLLGRLWSRPGEQGDQDYTYTELLATWWHLQQNPK